MQRHQSSFNVGGVLILFASINLSLQQTCSPTQFQCTTGSQCFAQTDVCDYYKDCDDNSDETSCPFYPIDNTKALVVLFANQLKLPALNVVSLYGNPAEYVPRLGFRPFYPLTNLSLPINFRSFSINRYDFISTMDVDSSNSVLIFGNNANKRIEWGSLSADDFSTTYITSNNPPAQVAAVAYDWVSKNVYWLDAGNQWIKVANIGQKSVGSTIYSRTVVQNIVNPRDIAVDPINAILFWISGACGSAQIVRSPLNGFNPTPLALTPSPSNNCPTKLAVDVNAQILYWLDANNTRVGYANYSSSSDAVAYWFNSSDFADMSSMTLFGNYVVLGSMARRTVNFYRKGTMTLEGLMAPFYSPALDYPLMDIATNDITNQPTSGSNSPCLNNNGGCSQLCFSTSPSTSICGCTEGSTTCVNSQTTQTTTKAYNTQTTNEAYNTQTTTKAYNTVNSQTTNEAYNIQTTNKAYNTQTTNEAYNIQTTNKAYNTLTTNKAYNTVICAAAGLAYLLMIL